MTYRIVLFLFVILTLCPTMARSQVLNKNKKLIKAQEFEKIGFVMPEYDEIDNRHFNVVSHFSEGVEEMMFQIGYSGLVELDEKSYKEYETIPEEELCLENKLDALVYTGINTYEVAHIDGNFMYDRTSHFYVLMEVRNCKGQVILQCVETHPQPLVLREGRENNEVLEVTMKVTETVMDQLKLIPYTYYEN